MRGETPATSTSWAAVSCSPLATSTGCPTATRPARGGSRRRGGAGLPEGASVVGMKSASVVGAGAAAPAAADFSSDALGELAEAFGDVHPAGHGEAALGAPTR